MRKIKFLVLLVGIVACNSELPADNNSGLNDTLLNDTLGMVDSLNALDSSLIDSSEKIEEPLNQEQLDNALESIINGKDVKTPEGALSFCDCVKKNDQLQDELMEADDTQFDSLLKVMDDLINGPCFILKAGQGVNTVEDKEAYDAKVKKCRNH